MRTRPTDRIGAGGDHDPEHGGLVVALSSDDVSLVLDLSGRALPGVVHWGGRLDGLQPDDLPALVDTGVALNGTNDIDVPRRLAVLPEQHRAWAGRPGLQGSRAGRDWSTRFTVDRVTLDGEPLLHSHVGGPGVLEVGATDEGAELHAAPRDRARGGGLVRLRATVTNTGADAFTVDALTPALPLPAGLDELLDFGGRWGHERVPQRRALHTGIHSRENRRGRTGADSAHVLHAGTPGFDFDRGEVRAVHTGWSGNHVHYAEKTFTGEAVIGGGGCCFPERCGSARGSRTPAHGCTSRAAPGSTWSPDASTAISGPGHGRCQRTRPVTLNVWEAVYFDHRLERLVDLAERAAEVGVERYVLDDGWFGARRHDEAGLGDWVVSGEVWPQGLRPLIDRVTGLGMQFGLWFEPEMVNPDSDVARAHPEWMMAARDELPVASRHQQVLDLTVPAAYEHVKGQILALLAEYDISYIKWDHNRDLVEAGSRLDAGRPAVHAQTLAVYRLLDEIRAEHPTLEIESCSSGGARVDLGILERTDRVWVSDVHRPAGTAADDALDHPAGPPGVPRLAHRLRPVPLHRASARPVLPRGDGGLRAPRHRVGPHHRRRGDASRSSPSGSPSTRQHRHLLLGGDLCGWHRRPKVLVHGGRPDRSEAVFALATVGNPLHSPGPRVRFTGLARRPVRVRPVVGEPPSGLVAPAWWGATSPPGAGRRPPPPWTTCICREVSYRAETVRRHARSGRDDAPVVHPARSSCSTAGRTAPGPLATAARRSNA